MADAAMQQATPRRIILLGASNLRQGLHTALRSLAARFAAPLHAYVACGFGRSYGLTTWIPFRSLPGITACGLWQALTTQSFESEVAGIRTLSERPVESEAFAFSREAASLPQGGQTLALITDVGNDLLYGIEVSQILAWVSECLKRLQWVGARSVVTLPPIERVRQLSDWRFRATRTLFFPQSRLTRDSLFGQIEELSAGLTELARQYSTAVVAPQLAWYGFDPIHIRRVRRMDAWNAYFDGWLPEPNRLHAVDGPSRPRPPRLSWIPRAHVVFKGNREQITPQPSYRGPGMDVSLY